MATTTEEINCGGFVFYNNFDSANLAKVEQVKAAEGSNNEGGENEGKSKSSGSDELPDYEFNVWTKHDCHGTEHQNGNRTWFYFGIKAGAQGVHVKLNVINLNKQVKMFSQGMCPVYKTVPGHLHWERIREKPTYTLDNKGSEFTLSFVYRTSDNNKAITYVAFTYPFSYSDLQQYLKKVDARMSKRSVTVADDIYYHRECAMKSIEGRRLELLTISSHHNISTEREARLRNMFPEQNEQRPFKFRGKKVIFVSARVHPGETPSTFVFNGFLNFLLNREDSVAINLRRMYVFKMIPMLNPDGVARGHYRMDTRGVNLNRVYLNPSMKDHPTIYAARSLIRYHHHCYELPEESAPEEVLANVNLEVTKDNVSIVGTTGSVTSVIRDTTNRLLQQVTLMTLDEKGKGESIPSQVCKCLDGLPENIEPGEGEGENVDGKVEMAESERNVKTCTAVGIGQLPMNPEDSGLFLYIDLHGHASKKGVFMYGNYFDDPEDTIMCMLLPKLMSINNPNFHFTSCNFAERNMYLIDKRDGMSREGSGRVAVHKLTGLIRSYTLECNYNSGRMVNSIPARVRDGTNKNQAHMFVPPKYTPTVFEEVGAALGPSILDLTNSNPNSRLPNSQYRSLRGVRSYLKLTYVNNFTPSFNRPLHKTFSHDQATVEATEPTLASISEKPGNGPTRTDSNLGSKVYKARRIYTAVKRIKSTRKTKPITGRRLLKSQGSRDVNGASLCATGRSPTSIGVKKKILKPSERCAPLTSNLGGIRSTFMSQHKKHKRPCRKLVLSNLQRETTVEETTRAVKQGSKRLKVTSPKFPKIRPEIGESSRPPVVEKVLAKAPSRALFLCNKQSSWGSYGRTRTPFMKIDQTKSIKSSKLKVKCRNSVSSGIVD